MLYRRLVEMTSQTRCPRSLFESSRDCQRDVCKSILYTSISPGHLATLCVWWFSPANAGTRGIPARPNNHQPADAGAGAGAALANPSAAVPRLIDVDILHFQLLPGPLPQHLNTTLCARMGELVRLGNETEQQHLGQWRSVPAVC